MPSPCRRRSGEGPGPGMPRRHTHARPRADGPSPATRGGPAAPAGGRTRLPRADRLAHAHTRTERTVPRRPPLRLARACADTPAGSAPTPTRNKERPVRTRSLGPAPPGRALGAGPAGGGSCDTAREAAELGGPRHILLRLRLLLPGSEPAERSQAEPRAPRARAEQGTEPWRTRLASTVRAGGGRAGGRGAAPPLRPSRAPAPPAPVGKLPVLFAAARRRGRHIWGEGAPRAEVGGCAGRYPAAAEVSVLWVPVRVEAPVCAHLWSVCLSWGGGARMRTSGEVCTHVHSPGVHSPVCAQLGAHTHTHTRGWLQGHSNVGSSVDSVS